MLEQHSSEPKITDPDLANVMGYAEYPHIEVARTAEANGLQQISQLMHDKANEAGVLAGNQWITERGQPLYNQVASVAKAAMHDELSATNNQNESINELSTMLRPSLPQESATNLEPLASSVGQTTLARIAGYIATRDSETIVYRDAIAKALDLSPATLSKSMAGFLDGGLITEETYRNGDNGRPKQKLTPTEKFGQYMTGTPEWQRAADVFNIAERLGVTDEEARIQLIDLGRASITAVQFPIE